MSQVTEVINTLGIKTTTDIVVTSLLIYASLIILSLVIGAIIHYLKGTPFSVNIGFGKWSHPMLSMGERKIKKQITRKGVKK